MPALLGLRHVVKKSKTRKEKVAALYESGNSSRKISKMFGVTPPTILKFMRKHDIKLRKYKKIGKDNEYYRSKSLG
jgi:hypothetical protein